MSYSAAIDQLAEGPNAGSTTVTVIEGRSRYEISQQVAEQGIEGDYMAASEQNDALNPRRYGAPSGTESLEGFLFPATYELAENPNVHRIGRAAAHSLQAQHRRGQHALRAQQEPDRLRRRHDRFADRA